MSTSSKRETTGAFSPLSTPLNQIYNQTPSQANASSVNTGTTGATAPQPPSTAARTYKTRERLYYETDYVKSTNSPANANAANPNLFEPFLRKQSTTTGTTGGETNSEELPPTASLHEYLLNSSSNNPSANTPSAQSANSHFSNLCTGSPMVINGVIGSPMRNIPNMETSMFVSGGSQQMTRSITVFGFPPNCRNEILLSFQSHGKIESFDAAADEGSNWLHVVYESEWAAQKALNRNGTIFQPTGVMIGVIPMQSALEKVNIAADSFMSPLKKSSLKGQSGDIPSIFLKKENSQSSSTNLASLPSESSIVTKAVNYIFGW